MENRKLQLLETLDAFVNQRPGLDPREYGQGIEAWRGYRRQSAEITRDMHDYYAIRQSIAWRDSITANDIIEASDHAFSGRLEIEETEKGFRISYCVVQYFPTEYRKAACAVLASAWWESTREDCPDFPVDDKGDFTGSNPGEWIRAQAKREFSRSIQRGYFN